MNNLKNFIRIGKKKDRYIFKIESIGSLSPVAIVKKAMAVLREKLKEIEESIHWFYQPIKFDLKISYINGAKERREECCVRTAKISIAIATSLLNSWVWKIRVLERRCLLGELEDH
jgi:hypothetical protein